MWWRADLVDWYTLEWTGSSESLTDSLHNGNILKTIIKKESFLLAIQEKIAKANRKKD